MEQNYTYILLCADNTLYTGWTTNLKRRLAPINAGTGAEVLVPAAQYIWSTARSLTAKRKQCGESGRSNNSAEKQSFC